MRITSDGNVGIGTASPEARLHLKNGDNGGAAAISTYDIMAIENNEVGYFNFMTPDTKRAGFIFSDSSRARGGFIYTHGDTQFGTNTEDSLVFLTNGFSSPKMIIDSSGNVGIGTTTPGEALDVVGNINATGDICLDDGTCLGDVASGSSDNQTLQQVTNYGTTTTDAITIDSDGDGTTTVGGDLQVNGDLNVANGKAYQYNGYDIMKLGNGEKSILVGTDAGSTAARMQAFGYHAGSGSTAYAATFIGEEAGVSSSGTAPIAIGLQAGYQNTGTYTIAIGPEAGKSNSGGFGSFIGNNAGKNNIGEAVSGFGSYAAHGNEGDLVTVFGDRAGYENEGQNVSTLGSDAGRYNTGHNLVAMGVDAGQSNSGDNVVAIGFGAGNGNTLNNQFIVKQGNVNSVPLIQGDFASGDVNISGDLCANGNCLSAAVAGTSQWTTGGSGIYYGGNVGIGTDSPGAKLDVNGTLRLSADSSLEWGWGKTAIVGNNNDEIKFLYDDQNSEAMRIDGGNVGINKTNPSHALTIGGGNLAVENGNIYLSSGQDIHFDYGVTNDYAISKEGDNLRFKSGGDFNFESNGSFTGTLTIANGTDSTHAVTKAQLDAVEAGVSGNLSGYMRNDGDTASGNYTFDSGTLFIDSTNNNIGMGTTEPQTNVRLDIRSGFVDNSYGLTSYAYNGNNGKAIVGVGYATTGTGGSYGVVGSSFGARATGTNIGGYFTASGAANNYALITGTGNVGIGTSTPTQKLQVNGSMTFMTGAAINEFSLDGTLAGNSTTAVPTESAVKTYVDSAVGTGVSSGISGTTNYLAKFNSSNSVTTSSVIDDDDGVRIGL